MKKVFKYLGSGLIIQAMPLIALAQGMPSVTWTKDRIINVLDSFLNWITWIIFLLGILVMLWAAFKYMTAGGDDEKIKSAKKTLIWGLVGVGVAILAFGVWTLVQSFLV